MTEKFVCLKLLWTEMNFFGFWSTFSRLFLGFFSTFAQLWSTFVRLSIFLNFCSTFARLLIDFCPTFRLTFERLLFDFRSTFRSTFCSTVEQLLNDFCSTFIRFLIHFTCLLVASWSSFARLLPDFARLLFYFRSTIVNFCSIPSIICNDCRNIAHFTNNMSKYLKAFLTVY